MENGNGMRLIIVDDDLYVLGMVATFLKKQGYSIAPFSCGTDALADYSKYGADLVLTDVAMPIMDGGELLSQIHAIDPDIPVILMTAYVNLEIAIDAIKRGAFDFIVKPFDFESLIAAINKGLKFRTLCLFQKEYKQHLESALTEKTKELEGAHSQMVLSEKMASIGLLSAGVAHEINNPVTFISSNLCSLNKYFNRIKEFIDWQVKTIQDYCPSDVIDEQKRQLKSNSIKKITNDMFEIVEEALDGVDHINKIVASLKTFSRKEGERPVLTNLNELIERSITMVWHEIKYVASINRDLHEMPAIECYPSELSQVIMNLLVNATHAIDKEPGVIAVKTWAEDYYAYISISDNGSGISEENIKQIFTPFFTTKELGKGTGLGLSISYDIIKKHNGKITVESTPGIGTDFKIALPLCLTEDMVIRG